MLLSYLLVFVTALIVSLLVIPITVTVAHKYDLLDTTDGVKRGDANRFRVHRTGVPRIGGLGIVIAFFVALALWADTSGYNYLIFGSIVFFIIGFVDDIYPLTSKLRLAIQVGASAFLVTFSDLEILSISIIGQDFNLPPILGAIVATFAIVGAINSVNMMDGLDGLAAGVSLISITMLTYLHYIATGTLSVPMLIAIGIVGAVVGFLRYNSHPAKIFMGDGGSNWLGYMMGLTLVFTLGSEATLYDEAYNVPFLSVALCIALPFLDTLGVMLRRIINRQSPFLGDSSHFHHTLLSLGLGQKRAVATIYFISLILATLGVFKVRFHEYQIGWLADLAFVAAGVLIVGSKFSRFRHLMEHSFKYLATSRQKSLNGRTAYYLDLWSGMNKYMVYLVLLIAPLLSSRVSMELGYLTLGIAGMIGVTFFLRLSESDFIHAFAISIGLAVILYSVNLTPLKVIANGEIISLQPYYNALFIFMAISVLLYYILTLNRRFLQVTPTDFLLIIIPLVLLLVPEPWQSQMKMGPISARAFVVFMILRSIRDFNGHTGRRIKTLLLWGLFVVMLKAIFEIRIF